ncbi:hypothetical protein FACS1894203_4250 [Bacteroidia bacterium]|nr:hypothetical protein FACS1894203_4250 [Bacteroidia bacterium]
MIYPDNFEYKIGFDKIRHLVSAKCLCPLGEEKVEEMIFSSDYQSVRKQLHQTNEFIRILEEEEHFPSGNFYDVRGSLKKIRIEGTYLLEKELFDIRRSLETINEILRFFQVKEEEESSLYPYLRELASDVGAFPQITKRIDNILDKFGSVKDSSSLELTRIRRDLSQTINGISKTLNSILRSAQSEGYVDKDVAPTMRDGRLVIPIAPAFKRKLKGIVHDESASGKTVFIEPAEVVEANNRIRELESEEKREIVRILTDFTNFVRPDIPNILHSYEFLALIDFIRAKAIFALDIQAILPVFEDKQQLDWIRAVHPLLYLSHRRQNKTVVPLDIELTSEKGRILLISGPNAGGKSVCLKTVGLLQYMLQCGMLIPLYESSRTGVFNDIFIDIGDEQSIENDLSTYSSHLTNMKYFVRNCNPGTIILIDEFGSGTEPQIGGAIAESLLDRFNKKQSFGVITTHYQNLKHYADEHEGVMNGAMLYDRHEMQPLFKLSIGNPGSSFAIEIARKIGLPEDVIADASRIVGQDYIDMDKYLQDIVRDKRYWESKRQNIRQQEKRLEELTERYQSDLQKIESQRKEIVSQAKVDAERLLSETNANIILPDGTAVWLNARTTVQYPSSFEKNKRVIILDGEAYFEVAHDKKKPFIVRTNKYDVEVTGTKFNVEAYSFEDETITSLLDGQVKLISVTDPNQSITMEPHHLAFLQEDKFITKKITDYNRYRWKDGLICFDNISFPEIMKEFEKYYEIQVIIENKKVNDYLCTGKFRQSDGVDYALKVLQRDVRFIFERVENTNIIYIK